VGFEEMPLPGGFKVVVDEPSCCSGDIDEFLGTGDRSVPGGAASALASQDMSELKRGLTDLYQEIKTCQCSSHAHFQSVLTSLVALQGIASRCDSATVSTCASPPNAVRAWVTKVPQKMSSVDHPRAENDKLTQSPSCSPITDIPKQSDHVAVKWHPATNKVLAVPDQKPIFGRVRTLSANTDGHGQDMALNLLDIWRNLLRSSESETHLQSRFNDIPKLRHTHTSLSMGAEFRTTILSPNSRLLIPWNIVGLVCLLYDAFTIPIELAWGEEAFESSFHSALLVFGVVYWTLCIAVSVNTSFFNKADQLVTSRTEIIKQYIRTWMFFDCFMVINDWVQLLFDAVAELTALKAMRAVRISRLMRLIKFRQMQRVIEEASFAKGKQWVMFGIVIVKLLFGIGLSAHIVASMWYLTGISSQEKAVTNWLEANGVLHADIPDQYLLSLHWVLAHITSVPISVEPVNSRERVFAVGVVLFTFFVVGYGITKLLSCINELEKMTAERQGAKRELRQYLIAYDIPLELSTRSMRFLEFALKRRSSACPDPPALSMLSEKLRFDLLFVRHGSILESHPLLSLVSEVQIDVKRNLCKELKRRTHEQQETVFVEGARADAAYLTVHGLYLLQSGPASADPSKSWEFSSQEWFSELCLFTKFLHRSTLMAETYADSYSLSLDDFVTCVNDSPTSIVAVFEYAQAYLNGVCNAVDEAELTNRFVADDYLPPQVGEAARAMTKLHKLQKEDDAVAQNGFESRELYRMAMLVGRVKQAQKIDAQQLNDVLEPLDFVKEALRGSELFDRIWGNNCAEPALSHGVDWLEVNLTSTFNEINPDNGIFVNLDHDAERRRALASTLCALYLLRDSYDEFVECQPPEVRMSMELWKEFQDFVKWTNMKPENIHTALVFLAIRGLGKVSSFADACPEQIKDSAEKVLLHGIVQSPDLVPSVTWLSEDTKDLLKRTVRLNEQFNFAQMLQGENNPWSVDLLKRYVEEYGNQALKFYIFCLVGMMCGLLGNASTKGSKFMNENNARNVLFAIKSLQRLESASPVQVYWEYILQRARHLNLPARSEDDLAFVRFACLNRVTNPESLEPVLDSWRKLDKDDRQRLVHHLRADGIDKQAVILTFLPLYLENARNNLQIGLDLALTVLIEFLDLLYATFLSRKMSSSTFIVNAADLAEFTRQVADANVFVVCPEYATLVGTRDSSMRLMMSPKNWNRVDEQRNDHDEVLMLSRKVNYVLAKQTRAEDSLAKVVFDRVPWIHDK